MRLNASYVTQFQPLRLSQETMGWRVPPEYLAQIDPFWLSFPAPDPLAHFTLGVLYIIFCFVSVVGNGGVLFVFLTTKELRTPSNVFIINLAFMDFLMMCKAPIMIYNSFMQGPALGWIGCNIFATVGALSGAGSSCANALIAFDRYKKIRDPMGTNFKMTGKKAVILVFLMWVYVAPWALLPLFQVFNRFQPEGFLTTCGSDYLTDNFQAKAYTSSIFVFIYVIPVTSIIFFYSAIFAHVREHEKAMKAQAEKMNVKTLRSGGQDEKQEIRVAKVGVMLTTLYLFAWTPYAIVCMMGCFGAKQSLTPLISMIPACSCKSAACLDPFVYAISHPTYRKALEKRWPCLGIKEKDPPTEKTNDSSGAASVVNANV